MVTFGHHCAKVTEKHTSKIYFFREDPHKEGLMEVNISIIKQWKALSKAGIFFVSLQSLLSTLKTLRYESK